MAEEQIVSESEKKKEDWMNSKWRPMMGWSYMLTCICDFVIFPILWSVLQALTKGSVNVQWQPITLQGAGLYHIAMGAVLGIAALGRTQEKMAGANNGGAVGTSYTPPAPVASSGFGGLSNGAANTSPSGFATPSAPSAGFGAAPGGFGSPAPTAAPVSTGFGGSGFGGSFAAPATQQVMTNASGKKVVPSEPDPIL